jgi:hypothetical protein
LDLKDFAKKIDDLLRNALDKGTFNEIGKKTADNIKTRTKLGKGLEDNNKNTKSLKPLSEGYKKKRKGLKKQGKLAVDTTPAKSNLTQTGDMLNSIKYEASNNEVRIYIEGSSNNKKATDQEQQGRKFMRLSKAEIKDVVDIIEKELERQIKG